MLTDLHVPVDFGEIASISFHRWTYGRDEREDDFVVCFLVLQEKESKTLE